MTRLLVPAALCLGLVACEHKEVAYGPSPVARPSVSSLAACTGQVHGITLDANLAGPQLLIAVDATSAPDIQVLENGEPFARATGFTASVDAHFGARYLVRARTGADCPWAEAEKVIQPNPCGAGCGPVAPQPLPPVPPPAPGAPEISVCFDEHFTSGVVRKRAVSIPAGRYYIDLETRDEFHRPGYQVGQIEIVQLHGVGFSQDIPDDVTTQVTLFDVVLPALSEVRISGVAGSVKGVCVTFTRVGQ